MLTSTTFIALFGVSRGTGNTSHDNGDKTLLRLKRNNNQEDQDKL